MGNGDFVGEKKIGGLLMYGGMVERIRNWLGCELVLLYEVIYHMRYWMQCFIVDQINSSSRCETFISWADEAEYKSLFFREIYDAM